MYTSVASFLVAIDETSTLGVDLDIVEIPALFQGKIIVTPTLDTVTGPGGPATLQGRVSLERIDPLPTGVQDLQNDGELSVTQIYLPALPINTLPFGSSTSQSQENGFVASTRKRLRFRVDASGSVNHAAFSASFRIDIEQFQATE